VAVWFSQAVVVLWGRPMVHFTYPPLLGWGVSGVVLTFWVLRNMTLSVFEVLHL